MPEFERRGTGKRKGLFLHGLDEGLAEAVECAACPRATTTVYRVSYDGVAAKFDLCSKCWYEARLRFGGFREAGGGSGRPSVG